MEENLTEPGIKGGVEIGITGMLLHLIYILNFIFYFKN